MLDLFQSVIECLLNADDNDDDDDNDYDDDSNANNVNNG